MVGSSSQLSEVVGAMKQNFTMKVTSASSTDVRRCTVPETRRRYLGVADHTICDRHAERTRHEGCKTVVTPAVNRNDNDDEEEEASTEQHRILRRLVGKSQFLALRRPDIAFATNRLARSLAKPSKSDITASKRLLRYLRVYAGFRTEAVSTKQSVLNPDSVHRQRLGWRSTHAQVRVFVGNHAGWIPHQCRCPNTVSDCSIVM